MNEKMYMVETVTTAAISNEEGIRDRLRLMIVSSIAVVLLIALAVNQLRSTASVSVDTSSNVAVLEPAIRNDEFAYYTERYWKMAEEREAKSVVIEPGIAVAEPNYAYYTERYWKMAESEAPVVESENYAYYTERYWEMAAAREAQSVAPAKADVVVEPEYAYYTERYWKMDESTVAEDEADYAYYTERYWRMAEER